MSSELVGLLDVADTLTVRGPGIATLFETRIIKFSTHVECRFELVSLLAIRIEAVFESSSCHGKWVY